MPPAPEVGHRYRGIGVIEILLVFKPHHESHADGHVRIAGEVKINLQRIRQHSDPRAGGTEHGNLRGKQAVAQGRAGVRNDDLFRQPHNKSIQPAINAVRRFHPVRQLLFNVRIADDGAGDELRKRAQINRHDKNVLLRRHLVPVDIDNVAHDLEGEKTDTNGKRDFRHGERRAAYGI